jgi:Fe-S-cluster containining protein
LVKRPVWRTFSKDALTAAAKFVRAGGHAVIDGKRVLLPPGEDGMLDELTAWALLEMKVTSVRTRRVAPIEGLLEAGVPESERSRVLAWCARDGSIKSATTSIDVDCKTCGACCHGPNVVVQETDLFRWNDAGKSALSGKKFLHTDRDENLVLRHDVNGVCVHLRGTECSIYELRPENCRAFPAGGNGCLSKRAARGLSV